MRILGIAVILFAFSFALSVSAQSAASDSFLIRIYGGTDTNPPTTPTLLTATGTAPTQVDLTWSSSTDDILFSGYVLFRDGVAIATTTQTSYSDTGLVASTTYSYFVRAYDFQNNYSTSSNILTVTTPDNPPEPVGEEPASGTLARIVADEVVVTPGYSTSSIYIRTPRPARFEIRWGRTASYELGFIAVEAFKKEHRALLTDLEPGTIYEYEIVGFTPYGKGNVLKRGRFKTLDSFDSLAPTNVTGLQGYADGSDVRLEWRLPTDVDLATVRIVRSHFGFPLNPNDGTVIYQGLGTSAVDKSILSQYSPVYYTAFAYDTAGNVSSGAVVVVFARSVPTDSSFIKEYEIIPIGDIQKPTHSSSTGTVRIPELFELQLQQRGIVYTFEDVSIRLVDDQSFLVSIPAYAVEQHLKSIIVTLQDPTDNRKSFSFLLRLNKDQTAYQAVIAPLYVNGNAGITVDIYDYQSYTVASYQQTLTFVTAALLDDLLQPKNTDMQNNFFWSALTTAFVLLALLLWFIVGIKLRKG